MAKYIDSLHKGLTAAKNAEYNRKEVDSVFEELNQLLTGATDGKVAIKRIQFTEPVDLSRAASGSLSAFFARGKYWALAAVFLPSGTIEYTELAKWEQDSSGYPCRLSFGATRFTCEDRAALEEVLETLLADSAVGEILHKYMNMSWPKGSE